MSILHEKKFIMKCITKNKVFISHDNLIKLDIYENLEKIGEIQGDETPGEICYLAPEVLREGELILSEKADSYSFGVLALEIITGKLLFSEYSVYEAWEMKNRLECINIDKEVSFLPNSMQKMLKKCLFNKPEERPSCKEIKQYFDRHQIKGKEQMIKEKIIQRYEQMTTSTD